MNTMLDESKASAELRALINKLELDGYSVAHIAGLLMTYAVACAVDSGVPLNFVVNEARTLHVELTAVARQIVNRTPDSAN